MGIKMTENELKTLKDIGDNYPETYDFKEDLKQEAIKWGKLLNEEIVKIKSNLHLYASLRKQVQDNGYMPEILIRKIAIVDFIKHFFDITDEDINHE